MKKTLFILTALLFIAAGARADGLFSPTKKYRFTCANYSRGSIGVGEKHGSTALLYYVNSESLTDDCYWTITEDDGGYVIRNAATGDIVTYNPTRLEGVAKGLQYTTAVTSDAERWTFEQSGAYFYIASMETPAQCFNVRTDGTYLVGTYATGSNKTNNELFEIYDEDGNKVVPGSSSATGAHGINANGEYWELTGLDSPVVLTTDTSDPVLYSIQNVRSGQYLTVTSDNELYESEKDATQFYFVQGEDGVQIYSANGKYVIADDVYHSDPLALKAGVSASNANLWKFGFSEDETTGYTVARATDFLWSGFYGDRIYWNDYNMDTYRHIGYYTCDGGSTFVFASSDMRHVSYLQDNGIDFGVVTTPTFASLVDTLRFNEKDLIYDRSEKVYYYPLSENLRGGADVTLDVTFRPSAAAEDYTLRVGTQSPGTDGTLTLTNVNCQDTYTMYLYKRGETPIAAQLRFTFLPIVEINTPSCNGSYYTTGSIRVTDPDAAGHDSIFIAAYKYRGASAQNYAKKSYAIKLRDADGASVDREFFGLRDDNNWILDAMAIDRACMRNRVSTDLWNDFSADPYHRKWEKKARTGTRGRFVEVFLNGTYHGLYCMTEKMDRKQLKLKKFETDPTTGAVTMHGSLYKSTDWTYETFMGHEIGSKYFPKYAPADYDNNSRKETWQGYEVKYPDYEEETIDWRPLWEAINFTATSTDEIFNSYFGTYFDAPVVNDYYLFIELLLATDNHGKNMFFFNYDQSGSQEEMKIGIAPWDLDGTWGRRWDGSSYYTSADQDFTTFLWSHEHGTHTLFHRLAASDYLNWEYALTERYAKLRATYFAPEALAGRFTAYADLFSESGADQREQKKWSSLHSNILGDVDYITDWIAQRVAFLDLQYDYTPITTGTDAPYIDTQRVEARGGQGCIYLHVPGDGVAVKVYSASGQLVRTATPTAHLTTLTGFAPGVYVVNGKKVLVE